METIEIKKSSAISKISFNEDKILVSICFTHNTDNEYSYHCEKINEVKSQLLQIESGCGSVGKLINSFRKDGTLKKIEV
jgi:hypothetical protein